MGRTLYLDCARGISGDMVVGALLDAGASEERLREALSSLGVGGFEIKVSRKNVSSLDACDFDMSMSMTITTIISTTMTTTIITIMSMTTIITSTTMTTIMSMIMTTITITNMTTPTTTTTNIAAPPR